MTRAKGGTRAVLRRLCAGLLCCTAVVFFCCFASYRTVHGVAATLRDRGIPAVIEIVAAKSALVAADGAAMRGFSTGPVLLSGPGEEFRNQLALASQNLVRAAEHNLAGAAGHKGLQLVEGLITSYSGLISGADVHFRPDGQRLLGVAELWDASRLLHGGTPTLSERDGILDGLDRLLDDQRQALDRITAHPLTGWGFLFWAAPVLVLFGLLCHAQLVFSRRFRRTINPPLLLATLLTLGLLASMSQTFHVTSTMDQARSDLEEDVRTWSGEIARTGAQGQRELADLLSRECGPLGSPSCGTTAARWAVVAASPHAAPTAAPDARDRGADARRRAVAAVGDGRLELLIVLGTGAIATLIVLGFRPRFDEYRYRP